MCELVEIEGIGRKWLGMVWNGREMVGIVGNGVEWVAMVVRFSLDIP